MLAHSSAEGVGDGGFALSGALAIFEHLSVKSFYFHNRLCILWSHFLDALTLPDSSAVRYTIPYYCFRTIKTFVLREQSLEFFKVFHLWVGGSTIDYNHSF